MVSLALVACTSGAGGEGDGVGVPGAGRMQPGWWCWIEKGGVGDPGAGRMVVRRGGVDALVRVMASGGRRSAGDVGDGVVGDGDGPVGDGVVGDVLAMTC